MAVAICTWSCLTGCAVLYRCWCQLPVPAVMVLTSVPACSMRAAVGVACHARQHCVCGGTRHSAQHFVCVRAGGGGRTGTTQLCPSRATHAHTRPHTCSSSMALTLHAVACTLAGCLRSGVVRGSVGSCRLWPAPRLALPQPGRQRTAGLQRLQLVVWRHTPTAVTLHVRAVPKVRPTSQHGHTSACQQPGLGRGSAGQRWLTGGTRRTPPSELQPSQAAVARRLG